MKLIWAPPPPTKAERVAMPRQCEATPKCCENAEMMKALQPAN